MSCTELQISVASISLSLISKITPTTSLTAGKRQFSDGQVLRMTKCFSFISLSCGRCLVSCTAHFEKRSARPRHVSSLEAVTGALIFATLISVIFHI